MHRIRDRVDALLVALTGPWLLAMVDFAAKVALGVVAIPLALIGLVGLGVFRAFVGLHWLGERTIAKTRASINGFIDPH
jgi:hypothetical protein